MQSYKKIADHYDVAIVGSDLSSLILAYLLSEEHDLKTILISAKQSLQDFRKDAVETPINVDETIDYYPATDHSRNSIDWLAETVLKQPLVSGAKESIPKTFESGEFKSFVGFGERKLKTIDAIEYYLQQQNLPLQLSPEEWVKLLLEKYNGEILHKSQPTQILLEEGKVKAIVLNETKRLEADRFIFCGSARDLLELVPQDDLPGRTRQKIAKSKLYHRLNMQLTFSEVFDHHPEIHILMGTKDDFEPVVDQFHLTTNDQGEQQLSSSWTYLLNSDEYEDPELMTAVVKYIKRQIKRAYPESFEILSGESISVVRDCYGHVGLDSTKIKGMDNFYVGSPQMGEGQSLQAQISSAQKVYEEFFAK